MVFTKETLRELLSKNVDGFTSADADETLDNILNDPQLLFSVSSPLSNAEEKRKQAICFVLGLHYGWQAKQNEVASNSAAREE